MFISLGDCSITKTQNYQPGAAPPATPHPATQSSLAGIGLVLCRSVHRSSRVVFSFVPPTNRERARAPKSERCEWVECPHQTPPLWMHPQNVYPPPPRRRFIFDLIFWWWRPIASRPHTPVYHFLRVQNLRLRFPWIESIDLCTQNMRRRRHGTRDAIDIHRGQTDGDEVPIITITLFTCDLVDFLQYGFTLFTVRSWDIRLASFFYIFNIIWTPGFWNTTSVWSCVGLRRTYS